MFYVKQRQKSGRFFPPNILETLKPYLLSCLCFVLKLFIAPNRFWLLCLCSLCSVCMWLRHKTKLFAETKTQRPSESESEWNVWAFVCVRAICALEAFLSWPQKMSKCVVFERARDWVCLLVCGTMTIDSKFMTAIAVNPSRIFILYGFGHVFSCFASDLDICFKRTTFAEHLKRYSVVSHPRACELICTRYRYGFVISFGHWMAFVRACTRSVCVNVRNILIGLVCNQERKLIDDLNVNVKVCAAEKCFKSICIN